MSSSQPKTNDAFVREMRIGLTCVAMLSVVFLYVAFGRLSGWYKPVPLAFKNQDDNHVAAPLAQADTGSHAPKQTAPALNNGVATPQPAPQLDASRSFPANRLTGSPTVIPNTLSPAEQSLHLEPVPSHTPSTVPQGVPKSRSGQPPELRSSPFAARNRVPENSLRTTNDIPPQIGQMSPLTVEPPRPDTPDVQQQAEMTQPDIQLPRADPLASDLSDPVSFVQQTVAVQPDIQPIPGGRAEEARPTEVMVQEHESYWSVSQRVYGDGRYFHALYEANKQRVPTFNELKAGISLITPSIDELIEQWPELCPESAIVTAPPTFAGESADNHYTTSGKESLFDIARRQLGQASRYLDIYELNRESLPGDAAPDTVLPAGLQLLLPESD